MIYITGDTHGKFDNIEYFCKENRTTIKDIMIILGDVGLNYYLNNRDNILKEYVSKLPITLFCIHGNHEERPYLLPNYITESFAGGLVYKEEAYPNILFAKDGERYYFEVDGEKIKTIVIGGAYSVDKYYRLSRGMGWFESEQPDGCIKSYVESALCMVNWDVDVVLSHTCPLKYEPVEWFLPMINQDSVDKSTEEWLDTVENKLKYKKWYCGHYHGSKKIDKLQFMFKDIDLFFKSI